MNKIILGHAKTELPKLPPESVNCCVTSPPYWSLRDYGVEGQLGLEKTFEEYITKLCNIFDEVKRVLRKDGTCWVNLGDTYASSPKGNKEKSGLQSKNYGIGKDVPMKKNIDWRGQNVPQKSLCLIPQRFAIEMVNRGWILRNTIIWHKPNCMPSSAKDRFTVDFEDVFFFTKSNKALFWTNEKTLECVSKQPSGTKGIEGKDWEWRPCPRCQGTGGVTKIDKEDAEQMGSPRARYHRMTEQKECKRCKGLGKVKVSLWTGHDYWFEQQFDEIQGEIDSRGNNRITYNIKTKNEWHKPSKNAGFLGQNPQGRNRRAVWTIPTQPFPEAHFAVYPEKLIEPMIQAGCPRYVCKKCGKARVKILEPTEEYKKLLGKSWHPHKHDAERGMSETPDKKASCTAEYNFKGYTDCGCNAGFEGGITIDPFIGAGTTAVVAKKQGKRYIGIEIKQEYIDMADKRIRKIPETLF